MAEKKSLTKKKKKPGKQKVVPQKEGNAPSELPKIVLPTASTMKEKIQASIAQRKGPAVDSEAKETSKKVGKLSINPFEQKKTGHVQRQVIIPAVKGNALSDIKKRYSSFFSQNSKEDEPKEKDSKQDSVRETKICDEPMEIDKPSPDHDNNVKLSPKIPPNKGNIEPENPNDRKKSVIKEVESTTVPPKKKSKEEMQSYLLSKLLFDDADRAHNVEKPPPPKDSIDNLLIDDGEPVELDPEYVREIEQYLSIIEKPKKKNKKKNTKKVIPQLKVVEVNNIKNRFERKKHNPEVFLNLQKNVAVEAVVSSPIENKVGMVKDLFETPKPNENDSSEANKAKRKTRLISNELLSKFDDPGLAEQMRLQMQKEREERKISRLQKLAEEKKKQEEAVLAAKRKEAEMLEALELERLRREEEERQERERVEQEERQRIALEKVIKEEQDKAELRRRKAEALQNKREKKEPAFRKKKVLGRIQHIFDQKSVGEPEPKQQVIGSIKDVAEELFCKDDEIKKKQFQDASLAGVSSVLDKMKTKFEIQDEDKPVLLSKGVEKRKSVNPAAALFEIKEQMKAAEPHLHSKSKAPATEWAWKKKAPQQLAMELGYGNKPAQQQEVEKPKKGRKVKRELSEEEEKELIEDIHKVTQRLKTKDALKEHEEKMREYEKFMDEIHSYLQEPTDTFEEEEFKEDIQYCITENMSNKKHKQKVKTKLKQNHQPNNVTTNLSVIKDMLLMQDSQTVTDVQDRQNRSSGNIKELQKNLFFQESINKEKQELSMKHIGRVKHHFDDDLQKHKNPSKVIVKKKIIESPFNVSEENETQQIQKSSYEWKYKKKNIEDLQMFLEGNKTVLPDKVSSVASKVGKNLAFAEEVSPSMEEQDNNVREYDAMMAEVDAFLNAPDRTRKEIDFKEEIEKYLDLIEEPSTAQNSGLSAVKEKQENKQSKRNKVIPFPMHEPDTKESGSTPQNSSGGQGLFINDLKNRLLQVEGKETKEAVHLPTVGASTLKRTYEKLSAKDEVTLLGPRTIKLQTGVDEAAINSGVKSLEQIKAEKAETQWKWKNKSHHDLYEHLREYDQNASEEIKEKQEKLQRAEEELNRQELMAKTEEEIENIKKLREEKEREFENFFEEIKACVEMPVEDALPYMGFQGYLDLEDDTAAGKSKRPSLYDSKKSKTKVRVPRKLLDSTMFE